MNLLESAVFLLLLAASPVANGAKILFISPFGSKSHMIVFKPLALALVKAGHEVTHITPMARSSQDPPGYKVIPSTMTQETMTDVMGHIWDQLGSPYSILLLLEKFLSASVEVCQGVLNSTNMQSYVEGTSGVDLVLLSVFFSDCFLPISTVNEVPLIYVSSAGLLPPVGPFLDTRWSPSYVPAVMQPFSDRMTFLERVVNLLLGDLSVEAVFTPFFYDRKHQAIVDRVFGKALLQLGASSLIRSLRMNASLAIVNADLSSETPRPYPPCVILAGGLHCGPSQGLPKDLEEWVTGSKDGFIYFSLGSAVQGKLMPEKYRKMFVEAFSRLPQYRILWKWETEQMDDLPKNVKLSKWLPQQDLLGHKDIKLFITHGGLLSTQESTYHGVPVVGIPIGADQMLNMKKTEMEGAGLTLEWSNLSTDRIHNAILRVLDDPSFKENLKRRSAIMRDQPETPLERAVFWTEYVIRHKGASHLRSAARELTWYQYHLIDVWLFIALVVGLLLFSIFFAIRTCFRCVFGRKAPRASGQRDKQD